MNYARLLGVLAITVIPPAQLLAASDAEVAELKHMLQELRQDYESRIAILENKIDAAEAKANSAEEKAQSLQDKEIADNESRVAADDNRFNPALSIVLQGTAANYSQDPDDWYLPGFQTGGEAGLLNEGLSLRESELVASASVDSLFYAQFTLGLHDEDGDTHVDVEEAFIDTLSLPAGLGMRFGRFYTETGYINTRHSHAWDFVDAPLVSQAFLGKQYKDDGVRLSWLAPTPLYLDFGLEALRGEKFPASGDGSKFLGDAQNYYVRLGGDAGLSNSYQLGLSHLRTSPEDRTGGHAHGHEDEHGEQSEHGSSFTGDSNLTIFDAVWKWAPHGNMQDRNLVLQGEYFYRDESGDVLLQEGIDYALFDYSGSQRGYYLQGIYQFMPRWRIGLRYDRLNPDNRLRLVANTTDEEGDELAEETGFLTDHNPHRLSAMLDWTPSEFSRLRLQYSRDESQPQVDDQFFLQYIMTIGAHGAHRY